MSEGFIEYARFSEAHIDLNSYVDTLKKALKANIAQQLFGPNAFEFILNEDDPMIMKILGMESSSSSSSSSVD